MTFSRIYLSMALLCAGVAGCSAGPSVSTHRLIAHQALLDFNGLSPRHLEKEVDVYASLPVSWKRLHAERSGPIIHQQWRSPSRETGVGIARLSLPFPITPKFLIWVAKMQYAKQTTRDGKPQGQLLAEWTDVEGREWFDASNDRFHVMGYAVTSGFDAWVVYTGWKNRTGCNWPELAIALRSVQTVMPAPLVKDSHAAM